MLKNINGFVTINPSSKDSSSIKIIPINQGMILDPIEYSGSFSSWRSCSLAKQLISQIKSDNCSFNSFCQESGNKFESDRLAMGIWLGTLRKKDYRTKDLSYYSIR